MVDLHRVQCKGCNVDVVVPFGTWHPCGNAATNPPHPNLPQIPGGYCNQKSRGEITHEQWGELQMQAAQILIQQDTWKPIADAPRDGQDLLFRHKPPYSATGMHVIASWSDTTDRWVAQSTRFTVDEHNYVEYKQLIAGDYD